MSAVAANAAARISTAGAHLQRALPQSVSIARFQPGNEDTSWRFFPRIDGGFLNALRMFDTARLARGERPASVVIASGPSFDAFVAGLFLSKFWRAPLVLDYRDEWTECPFGFVLTGNMDRYWEAKCLMHADRVIFTTHAQRQHHLARFGDLAAAKCHVIPNGWEPADWNGGGGGQQADSGETRNATSKVRISYVGTLADHASPNGFLRAIKALLAKDRDFGQRLEIAFVGHCSPSARDEVNGSGLPDTVKVVGEIPRPDANRAMRDADILLLIAHPELQRYIPGKLYEYVASGRPILVYGHEGEASRLVQALGAGTFVREGDIPGLRRAILELDARVDAPAAVADRQRWLERHCRAALAGDLFDLVEAMLVERGPFAPSSSNVLGSA